MESTFNFRIDKLDALICPKGRRHKRVMDTKVQGLGMRVRPSGAKTFVYYRRLPDNNESPREIIEFTKFLRMQFLESLPSASAPFVNMVCTGNQESAKQT